MFHFYTSWKSQKTKGWLVFWLFQGVYKLDIGLKWVKDGLHGAASIFCLQRIWKFQLMDLHA